MAVKKIKLDDLTQKFIGTLRDEIKKLPQEQQRNVEEIVNINTFAIPNPFGVIGVIPVSGKLDKSKIESGILQDHDVGMGVIVAMRYVSGHPKPISYVEYVMDSMTGLYLENNRPDRQVYPLGWEPLEDKWQNGEWWYQITFVCPIDHYEKEFEKQLINS
jgi:hypothetical protein